ncbi:hypothetical protein FNV43_RR06879 [Rhamnella rubrinervis]|uniref:Uncharacterized protein n=1 Tax=Rhamnella rubrinervis TaxID=2594499 RepID=A0A8K0HEC5_9ROSA|nr:hypothetical protein FNV43_RR06879 [Rhamnella rubrinervis]
MEESNNRGGLKSSLRSVGSFKSTLSGRSTPRSSPSFQRLHSSRTPRRESRAGGSGVQWFRSNQLSFWLLLITLWTYLGFYVHSRWAYSNKDNFLGFENKPWKLRNRTESKKKVEVESLEMEEQEPDIPKTNTSYGMLVCPFGLIKNRILEWSPENHSGTCDRKGDFARLAWSRRFVLIFHELSMTGAPLSMLELTTELSSCGATASAAVLSKKGGLKWELSRRRKNKGA